MKNITYVQCVLNKENTYHVAWIPAQYAKLNKPLKLRINKKWNDGWIVTEIWRDVIISERQAKIEADKYLYQREVSDI